MMKMLRKIAATTFLFFAALSGSAYAQSSTSTPVSPAPADLVAAPVTPLADLTSVTTVTTPGSSANAVALLDRIQSIVDDAMGQKPRVRGERPAVASGALGRSGQVTIDRADLDEIGAEIQEIKTALQTYEPVRAAQ